MAEAPFKMKGNILEFNEAFELPFTVLFKRIERFKKKSRSLIRKERNVNDKM